MGVKVGTLFVNKETNTLCAVTRIVKTEPDDDISYCLNLWGGRVFSLAEIEERFVKATIVEGESYNLIPPTSFAI